MSGLKLRSRVVQVWHQLGRRVETYCILRGIGFRPLWCAHAALRASYGGSWWR